jgi:hypothetical protein
MPKQANGLTEDEFYHLLAEMEPDMPAIEAPAAWAKFVQWRHYGQ